MNGQKMAWQVNRISYQKQGCLLSDAGDASPVCAENTPTHVYESPVYEKSFTGGFDFKHV